jgi:LuxR family transcriptional regulator, quorum-sensing system regulator BjaR1
MDFLDKIDQFIRDLDASPNVEAISKVLRTHADALGFEWLTYQLLVPPAGMPPGRFYVTTYPREWTKRYAGEGYISHDMVVRHATRAMRPFAWLEIGRLSDFTPDQQRVFHEAGEFAIRSGGTVPIHGPGLAKAHLTVASRLPDAQLGKLFAARLHELRLLATYLHERLLQLRCSDAPPAVPRLTPRELEVMTWTARGKTSEDIGRILAISDETVMKHIRNVCTKLDASNKTHATAVAILHGLIVP